MEMNLMAKYYRCCLTAILLSMIVISISGQGQTGHSENVEPTVTSADLSKQFWNFVSRPMFYLLHYTHLCYACHHGRKFSVILQIIGH